MCAARPPKPWERAGAASTSTTTGAAGPKPWELPPGNNPLSNEFCLAFLAKVQQLLWAVLTGVSRLQVKLLPQAQAKSRAQLQPDLGSVLAPLTLLKRQQ